MSRAAWIVGYTPVGSDDVEVRALAASESEAKGAAGITRGWLRAMEIHYRAGSREPRVGDRLGTWVDGSTRYAMAPRD